MPFSVCLVSNPLNCAAVLLPPQQKALPTPTLSNTLSWSSPPPECPPYPAWALTLHTRQAALPPPLLRVHRLNPVGSLIPATGHSHTRMSSPQSGTDASRWATFLHRCPPHAVQVLTSAQGHRGRRHPSVNNYLALPHLMALGLNCSRREGKERGGLFSFLKVFYMIL